MGAVKNVLLLLVSLVAMLQAEAQNFQEDLKKIGVSFAGVDQLQMEIEVNVFATHQSTKSIQRQVVVVQKRGSEFCYSVGDFEALFTKNNMLLIDHEEKSIHRSKIDRVTKQQMREMMQEYNPEQIFSKSADSKYLGIEAGMKKYVLSFPKGGSIETAEIYLNKTASKIEKVIYYYNTELHENASKVEIRYSRFDTSPTFDENTFSEKRYLTRSLSEGGGLFGYHPTEQYADYLVTSQE